MFINHQKLAAAVQSIWQCCCCSLLPVLGNPMQTHSNAVPAHAALNVKNSSLNQFLATSSKHPDRSACHPSSSTAHRQRCMPHATAARTLTKPGTHNTADSQVPWGSQDLLQTHTAAAVTVAPLLLLGALPVSASLLSCWGRHLTVCRWQRCQQHVAPLGWCRIAP
jgi:hypothetical protein